MSQPNVMSQKLQKSFLIIANCCDADNQKTDFLRFTILKFKVSDIGTNSCVNIITCSVISMRINSQLSFYAKPLTSSAKTPRERHPNLIFIGYLLFLTTRNKGGCNYYWGIKTE